MWLLSNSWTSSQAKCKTCKSQGFYVFNDLCEVHGRTPGHSDLQVDWAHPVTRPPRGALCLCATAWTTVKLELDSSLGLPSKYGCRHLIFCQLLCCCESLQTKADPRLCFHHMGDGQSEPKHDVICFLWGGESSPGSHAWIWKDWQPSDFSAASRVCLHPEPNGRMAAEFMRIFNWAQRSLLMRIWILGK